MKIAIILAGLMLAGCGASNVYDSAIPDRSDASALLNVRDHVKPEDADTWSKIVVRLESPFAPRLNARTVGEAITAFKARDACMAKHDTSKVPSDDIDGYNREVRSYNACADMAV